MIKSLEGARGIAALIVALFHLTIGAQYFSVVRYGYLFVDLFFVLSGFVIARAYSSRMGGARDVCTFILRRFGRLFPLMVVSTVMYVVANDLLIWLKTLAVSSGHGAMFKQPGALTYLVPTLSEIGGTLAFLQGMGVFDRLILNYASWSISVEFYTYLVFALSVVVVGAGNRRLMYALLSMAGLAVSTWASLDVHSCVATAHCNDVSFDFGFPRCIGSFFLGALVYEYRALADDRTAALQAAALAALVAVFCSVEAYPAVALLFPAASVLAVLSICRDTGFVAAVLKHKFVQLLGQRSFSMYMIHPAAIVFFGPVATYVHGITSPARATAFGVATMVVYLAALILVSGWSYRWIEVPGREWFNRFASRVKPVADEVPRQIPQIEDDQSASAVGLR